MDDYDFEETDFLDQWAMEDALQDTVYEDGELEGEEFGPWRYLDPPGSIHIKDSDDIGTVSRGRHGSTSREGRWRLQLSSGLCEGCHEAFHR